MSSPDFNIHISEALGAHSLTQERIGNAVVDVWRRIRQQLEDQRRQGIGSPEPKAPLSLRGREGQLEESLGVKEAAQILGTSVDTLRRLIDRGEVKAEKTPGGHRRLTRSSVETFLRKKSVSVSR